VKLGLVLGSVVFLIAGITLASNSSDLNSQLEEGLKKYENAKYGLSFLYPSGWKGPIEPECEGCGPSFTISETGPPDYGSVLTGINVIELDKPLYLKYLDKVVKPCNCNTLKDFVAWDYTRTMNEGRKFVNDNQTVLGKNYSAWQTETTTTLGEFTLKSIDYYAVKGNLGYKFSYVASPGPDFNRYLEGFNNMVKSVALTPPTPEKKPSFLDTNETEEPKSSTTPDNNTIFEEKLPPTTVGDKQASLYTKISPPDKKQNGSFQLRLIDNKTGKDITNVNYFLTITKGGNVQLRELFYSKDGLLTLKFQPDQDPVTVHGTTEPFLGGWMNETGPITVSGPVLTEGGQYRYTVEIFGFDNVRNIFKPENAPRFESSFNMKMNDTEQTKTEQTKPSSHLESNPNGLQILSHNSFTDSIGTMHVVGEVQNNSPTTATYVEVTGTFYDSNNQVVGTEFTYTNPSDIAGGDKAPFDLTLLSASIPISQVDHYNLVASSQ
jgi:hypothetical protein